MCVFDTIENKRSAYTQHTLYSLLDSVDFNKHRLAIYDQKSCLETQRILDDFRLEFGAVYSEENLIIIHGTENVGTARGINFCWAERREGENAGKLDNDFIVFQNGWVDMIEDCFSRAPEIGLIGLKRVDLEECVAHEHEWYKSELYQIPHVKGQRWRTVEIVKHVLGTCQIYSDKFLKDYGFMLQQGLYGLDDSLAGIRAEALGYKSAFLCGVDIDHIDPGGTDYTQWKSDYAGDRMNEHGRVYHALKEKKLNPYYNGTDTWEQWSQLS